MERSDAQLIAAGVAGDRGAFGEFVRRYTAVLFRFCWGRLGDQQLAEDAVQEAFLRLYRQILQGDLPEDPAAWLFAVARHCCRELLRRRKKHATVPLEGVEPAASDPSPAMDRRDEIESMLAALSDAERGLIYLKHVEGLRCRQIAQRQGKPLGTVTAALARAYRKLRNHPAADHLTTRQE